MAATTLPQPGTEYGPCPEPCDHIDCKQTREIANSICTLCKKPIGYNTRFYVDPDIEEKSYVHALCLEKKYER